MLEHSATSLNISENVETFVYKFEHSYECSNLLKLLVCAVDLAENADISPNAARQVSSDLNKKPYVFKFDVNSLNAGIGHHSKTTMKAFYIVPIKATDPI